MIVVWKMFCSDNFLPTFVYAELFKANLIYLRFYQIESHLFFQILHGFFNERSLTTT